MEFKFELHTTLSEQLYISVDISNITLEQLHNKIFETIEKNTIFNKEDILDIFVNDTLSSYTMSIPCDGCLVKDFIPMNRFYFPFSSTTKNTYTLYAIDRMYRERIQPPQAPNKREIKTSHMGGFVETIKEMLSFT